MATNPVPQTMTPKEYLGFDRASDIRHEYDHGLLTAMSGGTIKHSALSSNMLSLLREQLGISGICRTYNSDIRVQLNNDRYVYPDVVISCDVGDHQDENDILQSPRLVVEVLSPSTEDRDRRIKLDWYRECPTIYEYLLVNTKYQLVEVHQRQGDMWVYNTYGAGAEFRLTDLDVTISVDRIYEGTRVPDIEL